jgi:hypothetical protein
VIDPRREIISLQDRWQRFRRAGAIAAGPPKLAAKRRNAAFRPGACQTGTAVAFAFAAA